jgi:membrane-anchored protein YejM (alkaline phosphatase superfamily)
MRNGSNGDTHENGHTTAEEMKRSIDRPVAQLILDLEERGLLDRTLVVLASEFSRDMMTEGRPERFIQEDNTIKQPEVISESNHYGYSKCSS